MLVGSAVRRVAIIGGVRIPFARAHTAYAKTGNQEMLTAAFRGVVDRFKLQGRAPRRCRRRRGSSSTRRDYNLTRECVLSSGLDPQTPGVDLQARLRHEPRSRDPHRQQDRARADRLGLAGCKTDSISDAADLVSPAPTSSCCSRAPRGRTFYQRLSPWFGLRPEALQASPARCRRAAHGPVDGGRARKAWRSAGRSRARIRSSRLREPHEGRGCLARGVL